MTDQHQSSSHPYRRRQRRLFLALLSALSCGACVFFENSYDECFPDQTCDSVSAASGGDAAGDGDGDSAGAAGSHMHTETSGGSGGERQTVGSGGEAVGAGGDLTVLASGGENAGGTGGRGGGSGGEGSGGQATGGDGSGGAADGSGGAGPGRLVINELRWGTNGFVEIYNASGKSIDLDSLFLTDGTTEPNYGSVCALGSAGSLGPDEFLEVTGLDSCRGTSACVSQCPWSLESNEMIFLLENQNDLYVELTSRGAGGVSLAVGQSYSAYPDGTTSFKVLGQTPGASNVE